MANSDKKTIANTLENLNTLICRELFAEFFDGTPVIIAQIKLGDYSSIISRCMSESQIDPNNYLYDIFKSYVTSIIKEVLSNHVNNFLYHK